MRLESQTKVFTTRLIPDGVRMELPSVFLGRTTRSVTALLRVQSGEKVGARVRQAMPRGTDRAEITALDQATLHLPFMAGVW